MPPLQPLLPRAGLPALRVAGVKPLALGFVIGTVGSALVWIWAMTGEEEKEDYEP